MLTERQILILYLIASEPGIKGIYKLVKIFDRADFPAKMTENLDPLLKRKLIRVSEKFDNGTAKEFEITKEGENYLKFNFNSLKIISHIRTMNEPDLILDITQAFLDKQKHV